MSFLEAEGQSGAAEYPLWYLSIETQIAASRNNSKVRTAAILAAQAYASCKSKKSAKLFQKTLEMLDE